MAGIRFTDEQVSMLRSNPWVKSVTPKYVSFTKELMEEFIALHSEGQIRYEIFESHGLPVDVMGKKTIKDSFLFLLVFEYCLKNEEMKTL